MFFISNPLTISSPEENVVAESDSLGVVAEATPVDTETLQQQLIDVKQEPEDVAEETEEEEERRGETEENEEQKQQAEAEEIAVEDEEEEEEEEGETVVLGEANEENARMDAGNVVVAENAQLYEAMKEEVAEKKDAAVQTCRVCEAVAARKALRQKKRKNDNPSAPAHRTIEKNNTLKKLACVPLFIDSDEKIYIRIV